MHCISLQKAIAKNILNIVYFLIISYILSEFIRFFRVYVLSDIQNNIQYNIKSDIYIKILNLQLKAFDETKVGKFTSLIHTDANTVANIINNQFIEATVDIISIVIIGFIVFRISWVLSFITIVSLPFLYLVLVKFSELLRKKSNDIKILKL